MLKNLQNTNSAYVYPNFDLKFTRAESYFITAVSFFSSIERKVKLQPTSDAGDFFRMQTCLERTARENGLKMIRYE